MTTPPTPPPGRAPDPDGPSEFEPPTFETFETPSFESISSGSFTTPEVPPPSDESLAAPSDATRAPEPAPHDPAPHELDPHEPVATPAEPADAPATQQPTTVIPTVAASYAQWPNAPEATTWANPPTDADGPGGSGPGGGDPAGPGGGPTDRTLTKYLVAVGALFVALVLILVYAFVIRDDVSVPGTSANPTTSSDASSSSEPATVTPTPTEAPATAIPPVGDAVEGPFTFSLTKTETGTTVTSNLNEYLQKTATGVFVVVYVNVGNTGTSVENFLATLQVLKADGASFPPDDEASFYMGGGVVTINPGEVIETAIAFDVPDGTTPTSIELHGTPGGPGVELPL